METLELKQSINKTIYASDEFIIQPIRRENQQSQTKRVENVQAEAQKDKKLNVHTQSKKYMEYCKKHWLIYNCSQRSKKYDRQQTSQ